MPRFDGTGPAGDGPLTGRGAGLCNKQYKRKFINDLPDDTNADKEQIDIMPGRGRGRGFRRRGVSPWQMKQE